MFAGDDHILTKIEADEFEKEIISKIEKNNNSVSEVKNLISC